MDNLAKIFVTSHYSISDSYSNRVPQEQVFADLLNFINEVHQEYSSDLRNLVFEVMDLRFTKFEGMSVFVKPSNLDEFGMEMFLDGWIFCKRNEL